MQVKRNIMIFWIMAGFIVISMVVIYFYNGYAYSKSKEDMLLFSKSFNSEFSDTSVILLKFSMKVKEKENYFYPMARTKTWNWTYYRETDMRASGYNFQYESADAEKYETFKEASESLKRLVKRTEENKILLNELKTEIKND